MSFSCILVILCCLLATTVHGQREYSFDIWDWTPPGRDVALFGKWAGDLKMIGVTRIEFSAPWNLLEPEPGKYDLSFIEQRVAIAKQLGMGTRIRINSFWAGAMPAWSDADTWVDSSGKPAAGMRIPSICDERFWSHYGPMCTAIARRFRGEDIYYNSFIGMHAELKYGDWWSFDPASLKLWRDIIHAKPRAGWLARVVGDAPLPERPEVPKTTAPGVPDNSPASKAFIAFREWTWREACRRFDEAIFRGDPDAKISAPLGESYRRQSAEFSNLDYWGMTRGAKQVVHSYDFFWHHKQDPWYAAAAVASFRGITRLPVVFEFDGPNLQENFHYSDELLNRIADAAMSQGAGIKAANYSYSERLPSTWGILREFGVKCAHAKPQAAEEPRDTILLFVSKWANYCYREAKREWLHDAQFGAWKMLTDNGQQVRFICEDNLGEDLSGYKGVYVAFSPPQLMPDEDQARLKKLCGALPSVMEVDAIPRAGQTDLPEQNAAGLKFSVTASGLPVAPEGEYLTQHGRSIVVGYPLAYVWLDGKDRARQEAVLRHVLGRMIGK